MGNWRAEVNEKTAFPGGTGDPWKVLEMGRYMLRIWTCCQPEGGFVKKCPQTLHMPCCGGAGLCCHPGWVT